MKHWTFIIAVSLTTAGCLNWWSKRDRMEDEPKPTPPPPHVDLPTPAEKHVVMVIDDGIDTSLPDFQGKILAEYTMECGDSPLYEEEEHEDHYASYDQNKQEYLDRLRRVKARGQELSGCHLRQGISKKALPASMLKRRDEWNSEVARSGYNGIKDDDEIVKNIETKETRRSLRL